jgi:hypothetical protein
MLHLVNYKMKKLVFISFLFFIVAPSLSFSQTKNDSTDFKVDFVSKLELINFTEINVGLGLVIKDVDYALQVVNLSTIFGIALAKNFTGGIGIGYSFYNAPVKPIPLYLDFRYFTNIGKITVFAFGDCGIPLSTSRTENLPKMFASPGIGIVGYIGDRLSINFGAGLLTQFWFESHHDSFIIIKSGMIYSFKNIKD